MTNRTFNESELRTVGEAVKRHFTEENQKHDRITKTLAGLSESDLRLLVAASVNESRTFPEKKSWLGSNYLDLMGDELEATEIWKRGNKA
jgi:hypothetical protein